MALALLAAAASAGLPGFTFPVNRGLQQTEWGYMHYITSVKIDTSKPTLVLYHGNPRSVLEFGNFLTAVKDKYNFIATDYFGQGYSDDCTGCEYNTSREFVTVPEWVDINEQILSKYNIADNIITLGDLKGAYVAMEHAARLGKSCAAYVGVGPVWFSPATAQMVIGYIGHTRTVELAADGGHLLDSWHQPSAAPCDWVNSSYCTATTPATLEENEMKTVDRVRALQQQWQYIISGLAYNNMTLPNARTLAAAGTPRLVVWGTRAVFDMWVGDGFDPLATVPPVNLAIGARNNTEEFTAKGLMVRNLTDGSEGLMVQNATAVASYLDELLRQPRV